ncbi:hypothetical protein BC829DRAFT_423642 [Chytridium lagenaria]|nr:hypothetical protein BC829DRAFT_423642 [Chytridium lagenaria]
MLSVVDEYEERWLHGKLKGIFKRAHGVIVKDGDYEIVDADNKKDKNHTIKAEPKVSEHSIDKAASNIIEAACGETPKKPATTSSSGEMGQEEEQEDDATEEIIRWNTKVRNALSKSNAKKEIDKHERANSQKPSLKEKGNPIKLKERDDGNPREKSSSFIPVLSISSSDGDNDAEEDKTLATLRNIASSFPQSKSKPKKESTGIGFPTDNKKIIMAKSEGDYYTMITYVDGTYTYDYDKTEVLEAADSLGLFFKNPKLRNESLSHIYKTSAATVNELLRRPAEIHFTKSDLDLAIDCIAKKKRAETNNESETDKVVEAEETSFTKKLLKKRRAVIESDSDENIQTPKKTMRTRSDDRKEKLSRQIESISGMRKSVSKTLLLIPSATSILGFTHLTRLTHQYLSGSRAVLVCSIGQVGIRVGMTRSSSPQRHLQRQSSRDHAQVGITRAGWGITRITTLRRWMSQNHSDGSGSPAVEVCGVRRVLPQLKSAA